jgi:NADH dehydrogenase FAD-containing subunit
MVVESQLIEKLTGLNITVLLNERVERDGEGGQTIVPGAATLRLASGKSLQTDLQFWMAGAGRPHSEFAASAFGDALDPATGRIRVNEYGQIVGSTNAFAVGDIAQLPIPEQNLGYFAGLQGQVQYAFFGIKFPSHQLITWISILATS